MDAPSLATPRPERAQLMTEIVAGVEVPDTAAVAEATR
jgi:hypothetical protein